MAGRPKKQSEVSQVLELLKSLQEEVATLKAENTTLKQNNVTTSLPITKDPFDVNRMVTVIHTDDLADGLTTEIRGDSTYTFTKIGDRHRIRLGELERIMSIYKSFFVRGFVMIADKDIHDYFGLPDIELISVETYKNLGKLSTEELGKVYKAVCDDHKDMILRHWIGKCNEGIDGYKDFNKLNLLNKLSKGKMRQTMDNLKLVDEYDG